MHQCIRAKQWRLRTHQGNREGSHDSHGEQPRQTNQFGTVRHGCNDHSSGQQVHRLYIRQKGALCGQAHSRTKGHKGIPWEQRRQSNVWNHTMEMAGQQRIRTHVKIPGSFFIPEGKCRLLSPQHWAQAYKRATGMRAWEVTGHQGCTLYWEGGERQLAIPLGYKDNVATMQLTP
jgi:hypothetical protein